MSSPPVSEGKIDFKVGSETYQTWYQLIGDLKSTKHHPLVALHGGPGVGHVYLRPLKDLATIYGIPLILYDQLGCANSTHLKEKSGEFWTLELFMDELDNLVKHFGIQDSFDLLGHSWGGMLASTYAATRHPAGLKRLILSDSPASVPLFMESCQTLIKALPQAVQDALKKHEDAGTTESKEYQEAVQVFYAQHLCRIVPFPDDLAAAFKSMEEDPTVYLTMNGPSEFHIIGTIKDWSIIDKCHTIKNPTLLLNGAYDEVQDSSVAPFFKLIPNVKWVQFANSSHVPLFEERERYMKVIADFLALD